MTSTTGGLVLLTLLLVFTIALFSVNARLENNVIAAIAHMERLVEIEKRLVDIARTYLNEEKRKLSELAPFKKSLEEAMLLSEADRDKYMGNPLNSYLIIKRFTYEWRELQSMLDIDKSSVKRVKNLLNLNDMYVPSEKVDLLGATFAIFRLMDSYDITAREMSEGKLPMLESSMLQFTASDCVDIADIAHKSRRYLRMKQWLLEAERLINDLTIPHRHGNVTRLKVNRYLSWAYYLENDLKEALKYTNLYLRDDPENKEFLNNKAIYSWYVERKVPCAHPQTTYMKAAEEVLRFTQQTMYVQICKNKNNEVIGYKNVWNLTCYYRQNSPRLYLKPLKVTQLHDNPEVYILHDILSEKQMDKLKEIATPRLTVARVVDPYNNSLHAAHYRVSKSMFLLSQFPEDRSISENLNPIFESVSGLSMETGEELQMNNYGLGGQYEFHHDYGEPGTIVQKGPHGNRIATLLMYLSNVESGGETVFTEIGLSLPPMKGSALFWYNLHRNGSGFFNTQHASCPVIYGSKWVANKWIHERGNEFRRRCSLNQFE